MRGFDGTSSERVMRQPELGGVGTASIPERHPAHADPARGRVEQSGGNTAETGDNLSLGILRWNYGGENILAERVDNLTGMMAGQRQIS